MAIYLTPTTEIHLVLNNEYHIDFHSFTFEVIDNMLNKVPAEAISFLDFEEDVVILTTDTITNEHFIVAIGIGDTIGRVLYIDENEEQYECLVSIKVHQSIEYFWVGNNQITIHKDSPTYTYHGYVPSVFAKFSDGDIGDISYHPYVIYTEINTPLYCDISNHIIKVKSNIGIGTGQLSSTIQVKLIGTNFETNIPIKIKQPYDTDRVILEKAYQGINTSNKNTNILILSDGFKNKQDFLMYRDIIVNQMLDNFIFSPWDLLKENLTIWSAFEETNDENDGFNIIHPISPKNTYIPYRYSDDDDIATISFGYPNEIRTIS